MLVDIKHKQTKSYGGRGNTWKKNMGATSSSNTWKDHQQPYLQWPNSYQPQELPHYPPWQGPPPPCPRWAGAGWHSSQWIKRIICGRHEVSTNMRVLPISSGNSFQQILWWNQPGNLQVCIMYWNLTIRDTKMQTSADSSLSGCFCLYYIYLDNLHSSTQAHLINHFFRVARFRLRLGTCLVTKPASMSYRNFLLGFFWAKFFQKCQNYADTAIHRFISDYHLWHVSFTSWFLTAFIIWSYHDPINQRSINLHPPKKNIFGKFKLRVNFVLDVPRVCRVPDQSGLKPGGSNTWMK